MLKLEQPIPDIIIGGDFNLPHVEWPACISTPNCFSEEKNMISLLNQFSQDFYLHQYIDSSTHKDGNTLDLIFTNNNDLIHSHNIIESLQSITHHSLIEVATQYHPNQPTIQLHNKPRLSEFDTFNYFHENVQWSDLNEAFSNCNWEMEFQNKSCSEMLHRFYEICLSKSRDFVPLRTTNNKKKLNSIQQKRLNLCRRRRRINKLLTKVTSPSRKLKLQAEIISIEVTLQKSYKSSSEFIENKAINAIKRNSKYFFSYAKTFSKVKNKIGPLLRKNILISDPKQMAEILSEQYSSVFSTPSPTNPPDNSINNHSSKHINDISFNEDDIIEVINDLDSNSAPGPDGFPAILLKNCKFELSKPLYIYYGENA